MPTDIVIRTGLDRLRYALLFEGILVYNYIFTLAYDRIFPVVQPCDEGS
jgi:uncharacterized membrane protein